MEKDKIEHAVVYAYDYRAEIGYFDTAEEAKRKVFNMLGQVQIWKIQFCENISATQNDIYELRDRVQKVLDLLKVMQIKNNTTT